jgi:hypothetical protein
MASEKLAGANDSDAKSRDGIKVPYIVGNYCLRLTCNGNLGNHVVVGIAQQTSTEVSKTTCTPEWYHG